MAEMSVPAWPMPTHHTKLMIANPQAIGILMPQIPMPFINNHAMLTKSAIKSENEMQNPMSQPVRLPRRSTISLMRSVTVRPSQRAFVVLDGL